MLCVAAPFELKSALLLSRQTFPRKSRLLGESQKSEEKMSINPVRLRNEAIWAASLHYKFGSPLERRDDDFLLRSQWKN